MKDKINKRYLEKGQVIPLVILLMVAIVGMIALLLDGGIVMSDKRMAQAAADAAAMAGASELCMLFHRGRSIGSGQKFCKCKWGYVC